MKPRAWSHSALETHDNCPEMYRHKYILKDLPPETKTPEQDWGIFVHEQFQYKVERPGFTLPVDLKIHEPLLNKLITDGDQPGCMVVAEQKVALSHKPFGPCGYFDKVKPVWWRGVIDVQVIDQNAGRARIVDYKTGKKKDDWCQLAENALWVFAKYPFVNLVNAQYYWVQHQTSKDKVDPEAISKKVWSRNEIDALWAMFTPKLAAYAQSFATDTFAKKQSGLCRGWCPVTKCEFWEPKREKRK